MPRDREALLRDALVATDKIIRFTSNRSFDEYASSDLHVSAVERQFEILAECAISSRTSTISSTTR